MSNRVFASAEESIPSPPWLKKAEEFVASVMAARGLDGREVSVLFCQDAFIQKLNRTFRHIDSPTDILSFENGESTTDDDGCLRVQMGDITISLDALRRNAADFGVTENEELKRLLIHGVLHLSGYDHGDEYVESGVEPKSEMLRIQKDLMEKFADVVLIG